MFVTSKVKENMKKKFVIGIGIGILLITLFVNLVFQTNGKETKLTFNNVEALAADEDTKPKPEATCVAKGSICIGINSAGETGKFPGLITKF